MKRKELKNLAKKIADAEYIIQNSDDAKAVAIPALVVHYVADDCMR